jgi:hypothetical protein
MRELEYSYGFVALLSTVAAAVDLLAMKFWGALSDGIKNKAVIRVNRLGRGIFAGLMGPGPPSGCASAGGPSDGQRRVLVRDGLMLRKFVAGDIAAKKPGLVYLRIQHCGGARFGRGPDRRGNFFKCHERSDPCRGYHAAAPPVSGSFCVAHGKPALVPLDTRATGKNLSPVDPNPVGCGAAAAYEKCARCRSG